MADSDHWVPFDEDENYSIGSDQDINGPSLNHTEEMMKEQRAFIASTIVINPQFNSIEIHGADLNTKIIHRLFEQIHERLIQITIANDSHVTHKAVIDYNDEHRFFDIKTQLLDIKQPLISFRLIYVAMTCDSLSLLSNIIHLCCNTLSDIELELMIPVQHAHNHRHQHHVQITGLFDEIMRKCSVLPHLEGIGIDLINFPLNCYEYFKYFDVLHSFHSLRTLRIFICKENSKNEESIKKVLEFIEAHEYLDGIRLIVNDIEDDGIWDELLSVNWNSNNTQRFELFDGDVCKFNALCFDIINALNSSRKRCETLKAFSFCHYLSDDIKQYLDILSIFISKHTKLSELSIVFNCMSDIYLSQLLGVMHGTEILMDNLEYLEFDSTKLHDFELSNAFQIRYIENDDDDDDDDDDTEYKNDASNNNRKYKHVHDKDRNITQKHFGRESVLQLAELICKCTTLMDIEMKCWHGIDANAFNVLTESIINHGTLRKLTLNNVQRNDVIFDGLQHIFQQKEHSFLDTISIEFNRHYLDALRREKYTIPESFYQTLNNSDDNIDDSVIEDDSDEIEKQLRPHCELSNVYKFVDAVIESQFILVKYIEKLKQSLMQNKYGFSHDVIRIIVDYVVYNQVNEEENMLIISLKSLPNDMKSKLIQYFKQKYKEKESKWNEKIKRIIQINSCSSNFVHEEMNFNHEENDTDLDSMSFDPVD